MNGFSNRANITSNDWALSAHFFLPPCLPGNRQAYGEKVASYLAGTYLQLRGKISPLLVEFKIVIIGMLLLMEHVCKPEDKLTSHSSPEKVGIQFLSLFHQKSELEGTTWVTEPNPCNCRQPCSICEVQKVHESIYSGIPARLINDTPYQPVSFFKAFFLTRGRCKRTQNTWSQQGWGRTHPVPQKDTLSQGTKREVSCVSLTGRRQGCGI